MKKSLDKKSFAKQNSLIAHTEIATTIDEHTSKHTMNGSTVAKGSSIKPDDLQQIDIHHLEEHIATIRSQQKKQRSYTPPEVLKSSYKSHPQPFFKNIPLGIIILAGGQGTRLKTTQPKGTLLFDEKNNRSLFGIIANKIHAHAKQYGLYPHLAIMTSLETDQQTKEHFLQEKNFNLPHVDFFIQPSYPLLTENVEFATHPETKKPLFGPNGNGAVFSSFYRSPIYSKWKKAKIPFFSIITIDNPLIDPFHPDVFAPLFVKMPFVAAAIERNDPKESVGIFVQTENGPSVVEYSEVDSFVREGKSANGTLLFPYANISFFCLTMELLAQIAPKKLPIHDAKKTVAKCSVHKAELFLFDILPFIHPIAIVPIERTQYFAPVKDPITFAQAQEQYYRIMNF